MARDDSGSAVPAIVSFTALAAYGAIKVTPPTGAIAAVVSFAGGAGRVATAGTDGAALAANFRAVADGSTTTVVLVPDILTSAVIDFYVAGATTAAEISVEYRGL